MLTNEQVEMISVNELLEYSNILNENIENCDQYELIARYVKKVKNGVIGSVFQKENVFKHNCIPTLLGILNSELFSVQLRTDVAVVLGSVAKGNGDQVKRLVEFGIVPSLLEGLKNPSRTFVDACLRALRTIFTSKYAPLDDIYSSEAVIDLLFKSTQKSVSAQECVGKILVKSCTQKRHQTLLYQHGVIDCFTPLLFNTVAQIKSIALDVLSVVCFNNEETSRAVALASHMGFSVLEQMRRILSQETDSDTQLAAAKCLTYLCRAGSVSYTDFVITKKVMPLLVRLIKFEIGGPCYSTDRRVLSCETLAYLIEEDLTLQRLTSWNNMCLKAINQCLNVTDVDPSVTEEDERSLLLDDLHKEAFNVLSFLASNDEDLRRKIMQEIPNLLEHIVRGLYCSMSIQIASARCLLSLSRSVEQLRTVFMDKPVSRQLLQLLQSENTELAASTTAVACNLLLEFSPCKSTLIDCGCINVLCTLAKSEEATHRVNGIWALMNLSYKTDEKTKSVILRNFTPADVLRALTETSTDSASVSRLLGLLRNLLATKELIDQLVPNYGITIVQTVIYVLEGDYSVEHKEQALCVLVNLSFGTVAKDFIMGNEDILRKIINYMMHANPRFQIAAVCTIFNLVSKDDSGYIDRQLKLKDLGVPKLLQQLLSTKDTILFDKVKLAKEHMS